MVLVTASIHRVWTDDLRFALSRCHDHVVIERAHIDDDGVRHLIPVFSASIRDWVDIFSGLCAGAPQLTTVNFALLRHRVAQLFDGGQ